MRGPILARAEATIPLDDVRSATKGSLSSPRPGLSFPGVSTDSRTVARGELFIAIVGERFDGHDFVKDAAARGAAGAVVARDVEAPAGLPLVRVADTTRALLDLARHVRLASEIPVVGITGSTGKTTTKDMTAALLESRGPVLRTEGNLNNQYGVPLTLLRILPEHWAGVVEMGMSAPGELRTLTEVARPDVAVITNVGPAHLGFFRSVDAIADAKAEILEGLRPGGVAVLNGDDPRLVGMGERFGREVVFFGRDRRHEVSAEDWRGSVAGMRFVLRIGGRSVDIALPVAGLHNVSNFLAAAAAAHRLGVDAFAIAHAAARIETASHRGRFLVRNEEVTVLDDSYNASPDAVLAAAQALGLASARRRVAFLGDMLELGDAGEALHRQTGERLAGLVDVVVGVGPLSRHVLEGAKGGGRAADSLHHFPDSEAAAREAASLVRPGDAVLVKGSRAMRMERVLEALLARYEARERP